jgi:putative ABC transport system permease protein
MNWILGMALRNIKRNRRRTALAVSSIALSVMLMTFLGGFVSGILDNMVRNLTRSETGHVRVITQGFEARSRFMPVDELVPDPEAVAAAIEGIPELEGRLNVVSQRLLFGTLLSNGPKTKAAMGFSGDPEKEKSLLNLDRSIVEGRYLSGPGELILGSKLADALGFGIGDTVRVVSQGSDYGLRLKRFTVTGIFSSGLHQLDSTVFQVPISDAKEFLRTDGGVQQVLVMLDDYRDADKAAALIRAALAGLPGGEELLVQPWTAIGDYPRLIRMMAGIYEYVFFVVAFLGAFIITNILMMVVLERRREIGILKAMGLKRREVLRLFLAEGAVMGGIGSGIGAALGLGLCYLFSVYGIDFSDAMGSLSFPIDPIFYARFNPLDGLKMFAIGLIVSMLMSISPSWRAGRMNAVDAIKSVA